MEPDGKIGRPLGHSKINDVKLMQLLRDNKTRQQCATYFGCTISAIKAAEKRIKHAIEVAHHSNNDEVSDGIDSVEQLKKINLKIIEQLSRCDRLFEREEARTVALEKVQKKLDENPHDIDAQSIMDKIWTNNLKGVLAIQTNTINVSGEIRKQVELQLKIAETLYNIQMMQEFQAEMIALLKEVDPFVAQKFKTKLQERKMLRGLVKVGPV
jgi:hypothetical protein